MNQAQNPLLGKRQHVKHEENPCQISINRLPDLEDLPMKEQGFNHNTLGHYLLPFPPAKVSIKKIEDHHG